MIDIIDNFVTEEEARMLQHYMMNTIYFHDEYTGYRAVDFHREHIWHPVLEGIASRIENQYDVTLQRAWSFIYDRESNGVPLHADPAKLNVNIWVTPEEQMNMREGYNGLVIYPVKPPEDWKHNDYNGSSQQCKEFINATGVKGVVSEYKYRRATIFSSKFFHESQSVSAKTNRISWTFLFD
jgi:hypothetical protein